MAFLGTGKFEISYGSDAIRFLPDPSRASEEATSQSQSPTIVVRTELHINGMGGLEGVSYPSIRCYENQGTGEIFLRDLSCAKVTAICLM